jgi:hypothetical protein
MMSFKNKLAAAVLGMAVTAGVANAGTVVVFSDSDSIATQSTNWGGVLNLDQYNGVFDCVKITLTSSVFGDVNFESLDAAPSTITYSLQAQVTASGPGGVNVVVLPLAAGADNVTAFDGIVDFGGGSGRQFLNLTNSDMDMQLITNPVDLLPFFGVGTIAINVNAVGQSSSSGAGNIVNLFRTDANAFVTIEYLVNEIPTPAALPAGLALLGAFALRRRVR